MRTRRMYLGLMIIVALVGGAAWRLAGSGNVFAQQTPAQSDAGGTIKVETRLVLVDTIVTDKKGNYITDLQQKDFKVLEDDKEQPVKSFSRLA